jgi:hypothetical protein
MGRPGSTARDPRGQRSGGRLARLTVGVLAIGLGAPLALLHVAILWDRIASLTLLEPAVAARWAAAALVVVGLWRLRRTGVSLLRGRRAMVFWILALFLHVSFATPVAGDGEAVAPLARSGGGLLVLLPVTAPLAVAVAVLLLAASSRPARAGASAARGRWPDPARPLVSADRFPALFSRPPPLAV